MTISPDEIAAMKSACREVEEFRSRRKWVWCWIAGEVGALWYLDRHFDWVGKWAFVVLALLAVKTFRDWLRFKSLSLRFPANMQALQRWRDQGLDVRRIVVAPAGTFARSWSGFPRLFQRPASSRSEVVPETVTSAGSSPTPTAQSPKPDSNPVTSSGRRIPPLASRRIVFCAWMAGVLLLPLAMLIGPHPVITPALGFTGFFSLFGLQLWSIAFLKRDPAWSRAGLILVTLVAAALWLYAATHPGFAN